MTTSGCHIEPFTACGDSVRSALANAGAFDVLRRQRRILIKPNLVNASPPPVTFPVRMVTALVEAIRDQGRAEILIAEGCGDRNLSTADVYRQLGYREMAARHDIALIDLNEAPLRRLENSACTVLREIYLPEILFDSFVISAAVLKAHSLADVTLSMKNMLGCAPPEHYQQGGYWKKASFHDRMHEKIFELNRYRSPDLAFVDATVGLAEYHLGGPTCDPPPDRLIVGSDPVAVDAAGACLLGRDWRTVGHLRMADGVLGQAAVGEAAVAFRPVAPA